MKSTIKIDVFYHCPSAMVALVPNETLVPNFVPNVS